MKKLLVTGASGFLGWHVCRFAQSEWNVLGTVFSHKVDSRDINIVNIDLTDSNGLKRLFINFKPDAVIHTAAAANPDFCQEHPGRTRRINVDATIHLAELCSDKSIPFLFTSTDLVFDGLNAPYVETDSVSPVSFYGEQKAAAEKRVLSIYPIAVVCRMAIMFGSAGPCSESFIQPMIRAAKEGRIMNLFTDEFRTPVNIRDAVAGLFLSLDSISGILHLGGRERVSRYDFGKKMSKLIKSPHVRLNPCKQVDVKLPAPRSKDVSFDISKAESVGFNPGTLVDALQEILQTESRYDQ